MRRRELTRVAAVAVAWAGVQATAGYVVHRLPDRWLDGDRWLFRERPWERAGALYVETLRIRHWKHLLPEAGDVFAGGFDKRELGRPTGARLARHLRESRRAELAHWLALIPTPLFMVGTPPQLAALMPLYALAVNGPCIAAQRYNRIRLRRVLARLAGRVSPS